MKLIVCCIAVLAVANLAQCWELNEETVKIIIWEIYVSKLEALVNSTGGIKTVCSGYGPRFMNATKQCTKYPIDVGNETMCSAVQNHVEKCLRPVVSLFEECLPEKYIDIPAFLLQSILSSLEYVCKTDEKLLELGNPCPCKGKTCPISWSWNHIIGRCERQIESRLQQYNSKLPTKDEICDFMSSFRGCLRSHLYASCGKNKTRKAFFINFLDAAVTPCKRPTLNQTEVLGSQ